MERDILVYDGLHACPYLPGQVARLPLRRSLVPLTPADADRRFASAERRVGTATYRVACPSCRACEGIRVPVDTFRPTRSQRRVLKRWPAEGRIETGPVTVDPVKLALFNAHKRVRGLAESDDAAMGVAEYAGWFMASCFETIEMRYYLADRLVGVGILDLGARSASSVYFYFDPASEVSRLSPGVYSALQEIAFCRETGRDHLYLGLYVAGCDQLNYKADYRPHERLVDGDWRRFD